MDYRCPHCSESLRWKRLPARVMPKDSPRLAGARAYLTCPYCRGAVMANPHPMQYRVVAPLVIAVVAFTVIPEVTKAYQAPRFSTMLWGYLAIMLAYNWWIRQRHKQSFKSWPYYKAFPASADPSGSPTPNDIPTNQTVPNARASHEEKQ